MTKPVLEGFDPTTIDDPALREVVQTLMNQVEALHEQNRIQAAEIQRLRDEIARLKGEQGNPDIKPSRHPREDRSSETERKPPPPHVARSAASATRSRSPARKS